MKCEVLSTGDEIRSGAVTDTNSAYIAAKIEENGLTISRHLSVGDSLEDLVSVLKEIGSRSDFAVVTGGLGPTNDDITAKAAAIASGKELEFSEEAFKTVEKFFIKRDIEISESNRKQAFVPKDSVIIPNETGTAPGFMCEIDKSRIFFLPGVPYEMRGMLKNSVIPLIKKLTGQDKIFNKMEAVTLFNLPESIAGDMVAPLEDKYEYVSIGLRARFPQIQIRLYGKGPDEDRVKTDLKKAKDDVIGLTSRWVVSEKGRTIEEEIAELLTEKKETVAFAESCTGGLIGSTMTDIPGSSDFFLLSAVTYSNEAKMKVLGVKEKTLIDFGAVSVETAKEMAEGVRKVAGSTYGVSTSGIAGPTGGTDDKPVGTVCIGISTEEETLGFKINYKNSIRSYNKKLFAAKALDLLRRKVLNIEMI